MIEIRSPLQGTIVRVATVGTDVASGAEVLVIESMKMEHSVDAPESGSLLELHVAAGDLVQVGDLLASLQPGGAVVEEDPRSVRADLAPGTRADLAEVRARHELGLDEARPDAVERRRGALLDHWTG